MLKIVILIYCANYVYKRRRVSINTLSYILFVSYIVCNTACPGSGKQAANATHVCVVVSCDKLHSTYFFSASPSPAFPHSVIFRLNVCCSFPLSRSSSSVQYQLRIRRINMKWAGCSAMRDQTIKMVYTFHILLKIVVAAGRMYV